MRVLIVGAGIAGLGLALALARQGMQPVVIEQAAEVRSAGYMIDFFGPGYDAAEHLGLLPRLEAIHFPIDRLAFRHDGGRGLTISYARMRHRLFADRHANFLRGDLETALYEEAKAGAEFRFHTTVHAITAHRDGGIEVTLTDGTRQKTDLLVGADGVHSRIRRLVFGPEEDFRLDLGHLTAAYLLDRLPRGVDPKAFTTLTHPGRMVGVYPLRGGRAATLFVHRSADPGAEFATGAHTLLPRVYDGMGWVVPEVLDALRAEEAIYFDEVTQIRLERWHQGRVVLLGDAAWCVSLMAGQGASLALAGAEQLAEALAAHRHDVTAGLQRWETRLRPMVQPRQDAGRRVADWFVPATETRLRIRDAVLRTSTWPGLCRIAARQMGIRAAA